MTARTLELNSRVCADLRVRPLLDAAVILVVSLCVAVLRVSVQLG